MTDLSPLCSDVLSHIHATDEYKRFNQLLKEVKADEELYKRVMAFRERKFLLQQTDTEDLLDMYDALTNEYEDVINIKLVNDFLESEEAFCRMIQVFYQNLLDGLEIE